MIVSLLLPLVSPSSADGPKVLIALMGWGTAVAMLPDLGIFPWGNPSPSIALGQRIIAMALVIGSVSRNLLNITVQE
ncbi:hypothetical protein C1752_17778 [Acaryochloris thomasi RCC1774]|uniref:Uncharacterized protein n=1 Tax=Acaryochloris thomasi RCC1774 TaxID=1764569 RepID=A0A2W1JEH0_9CYAN|nr:hypothetical protein C1752_17778 [Acaryochloris thomasi RCC1774]